MDNMEKQGADGSLFYWIVLGSFDGWSGFFLMRAAILLWF